MADLGSDLISAAQAAKLSDSIFTDATWVLPGSNPDLPQGYVQGAKVFDLGTLKAKTPQGSAFPDAGIVTGMLSALGITASDPLVLYDRHGLFSAPRVWWTLKSVGHTNVRVINGGLPAMLSGHAHTVSELPTPSVSGGVYHAKAPLCKGVIMADVLNAIGTDVQIIDARPAARFHGASPEPREGLRSGHIPTSINLPFGSLLTDDKMITAATGDAIGAAGIDLSKPIITTCGSGVTAAGLAFIFDVFGAKDVSVYSGSWAEYGASDAPIEV